MSDESRLRIIHAVRSDAFAGVEQFVRRLAVAQAAAGHRVHVIGGAPEHLIAPLAAHGIGFTPASRTRHVVAALRDRGPGADVVNTHMSAADVAAAQAYAGRRRPAVVSTRHFTRRRGRFRLLPLDPFVRGVIDAEISISRAVAAATGVPSIVVYTGVELAPLVGVADRDRTVLVAQRLEPEKQTVLAVEAFARSGLADDGWRLDVAGVGAEAEDVAQAAAALGPSARMLGFRDDVAQLMARAGILLAPTSIEALGLSVLEAMACGLPVVAAAGGGHLETMGGLDERALFSPGDADAAAASLHALADDPAGRARLGEAEHERVGRDFSLAAQVARTDAVYRTAIESRSKAGSA